MTVRRLAALFAATALTTTLTTALTTVALSSTAGADPLPPLDSAALSRAIAGLPDGEASGALVRISGTAGHWQGTSGVADLRTGRPVPRDARFRIGSMTKTFTSTAVLGLAARGRIDLNRSVQSYLPDLLPTRYPAITIRQLINYTSGLPPVPIDHKDPAWFLVHRFDTWTPRRMIDLATTGHEIEFEPGTEQHYGNIGHLVAGMVIEKVTGRPYGDTVRDLIIRPLGLFGTSVPGSDPRIHGPHAHGYEAVTSDGKIGYVDVTEANPTFQWAAAEMISTARDLDRFLVALISGRLLPPAQQAELFAVPDVPDFDAGRARFGGGLARFELGGLELWGKTGDRPGYNSAMVATRDLGRVLVYSVNTLHMGGDDQPKVAQRIIAATAGLPSP